MKLSQLEYTLPVELISNEPAMPRDHSRLMMINRANDQITSHNHFYDLPDLLTENAYLYVQLGPT